RPEYLVHVEVGPDVLDLGHRLVPAHDIAREDAGRDGARGRADDDRERPFGPRMDFGQSLENAHLERSPRAAARQDEAGARYMPGPAAMIRLPHAPYPFLENHMLALRRILVTALIAVSASVCAETPAASPAEGTAAPAFKLQDQKGEWHSLKDYKGKWVVLYFYPKDETSGCTTQACGFRDNYLDIEEKNAVVLGVSPDNEKS